MILTYNAGNPPIKQWINENIGHLHKDEQLKKIFPYINVVTRQGKSIKNRIMRNKHEPKQKLSTPTPPEGN